MAARAECSECGWVSATCRNYFTAKSCAANHRCWGPERRAETARLGAQRPEQRERRRKNSAAWYQAHSDEAKARAREYHAAHREEIQAKVKRWAEDNREYVLARQREYRAAHREELNARRRVKRALDNAMKEVLAS